MKIEMKCNFTEFNTQSFPNKISSSVINIRVYINGISYRAFISDVKGESLSSLLAIVMKGIKEGVNSGHLHSLPSSELYFFQDRFLTITILQWSD